jgi:hypothetical protein
MGIFDEYKRKMETAPDLGVPGNESDIVDELLISPPDKVDPILEWIFSAHKGYVEPRAQAGQRFLERNPKQGWLILERLMRSSDPDDRDVAITVLERAGDKNKFYLAKPLLEDPYPYLQFEGVELLANTFPAEVKAVLQSLLSHEQEWV